MKLAHCSGTSSSKKIASTGQTSAQTPQSIHSSGLMKYCSAASSEWIQSTGQTSTQDASFVPMHGSVMTYVIACFLLPTHGKLSHCDALGPLKPARRSSVTNSRTGEV